MFLLMKLCLMGALLFGGLKTYATIPLLNENPQISGLGASILILLLLFTFPKMIGFFLKFALFAIVVFGLCRGFGLDFDTIVEKLSNVNISEKIDALKITEPYGNKLVGRAGNVLSGNTFSYNGEIVRLYGIDVPDITQTCKTQQMMSYACGQQSAVELNALIRNKDVECVLGEKDAAGARMATCYVDDEDVAALMVHDGWAIADRGQTDKYVEEERSANKIRQAGLWNGYFEEPSKWRAKKAAADRKAKEAENAINEQAKEQEASSSSSSSKGLSPIRGLKKLFGLDK